MARTLSALDALGGERLAHAEGAALTGGTVHLDFRTVRRADRFHDREAEARPTLLTRARAVDAKEALEHVRQRLRRDADARVGDVEHRVSSLAAHAQRHLPAVGGVLDGV